MSEIYGSAMTNELSSSVDFRFGPIPADRTSTGSRLRRFHPYMGCNLSRQRNMYGGNVGTDYLPGLYFGNNFSTGTEQGSYLSGYSHTLGAGAFLTNALCQQDLLAFNIGVQQRSYQQPYDMKVLQNLCSPVAQTGTNYPISSSKVGKDRGHPFYSRRRAEPAEGMTRTKEKYRVVYTDKQRKGLEEEYNTNKFITTERKAEISEELGLSVRQIKIWFQNRRAKERRDSIKGKDTEQTEHSTEDNNNIDDHSQNSLAHANFSTSCRFSGSEAQPEERLYSSGQCRFMNNSELGGTSSNILSSSNANLLKTRDSGSLRHSVSPSEWSTSAENNFIPYLDVSPLTGNVNFNFGQRL